MHFTHLSKNRTWHNNNPGVFKKTEGIEYIWLCVLFFSRCNCLFWQTHWREHKHCSFSFAASHSFQAVQCTHHGLKSAGNTISRSFCSLIDVLWWSQKWGYWTQNILKQPQHTVKKLIVFHFFLPDKRCMTHPQPEKDGTLLYINVQTKYDTRENFIQNNARRCIHGPLVGSLLGSWGSDRRY